MFRIVVLAVACAAAVCSSGCNLVPWVAAHQAELAATAVVAGTVAQVGGALVQVDEVEKRIAQRVNDEGKDAERGER